MIVNGRLRDVSALDNLLWSGCAPSPPRAQAAGVQKAPRHEVAGSLGPAGQRALWGFDYRGGDGGRARRRREPYRAAGRRQKLERGDRGGVEQAGSGRARSAHVGPWRFSLGLRRPQILVSVRRTLFLDGLRGAQTHVLPVAARSECVTKEIGALVPGVPHRGLLLLSVSRASSSPLSRSSILGALVLDDDRALLAVHNGGRQGDRLADPQCPERRARIVWPSAGSARRRSRRAVWSVFVAAAGLVLMWLAAGGSLGGDDWRWR